MAKIPLPETPGINFAELRIIGDLLEFIEAFFAEQQRLTEHMAEIPQEASGEK